MCLLTGTYKSQIDWAALAATKTALADEAEALAEDAEDAEGGGSEASEASGSVFYREPKPPRSQSTPEKKESHQESQEGEGDITSTTTTATTSRDPALFSTGEWHFTDNTKKGEGTLQVGRTRTASWSDDPNPPEASDIDDDEDPSPLDHSPVHTEEKVGEDGTLHQEEEAEEGDQSPTGSDFSPLTQKTKGRQKTRWTGKHQPPVSPKERQQMWETVAEEGGGDRDTRKEVSSDKGDGPHPPSSGQEEELDQGSYSSEGANDVPDNHIVPERDEDWHDQFPRRFRRTQRKKKRKQKKQKKRGARSSSGSSSSLSDQVSTIIKLTAKY